MPIDAGTDLSTAITRVIALYFIVSAALTAFVLFAVWAAHAWKYWVIAFKRSRRAAAAERQANLLRKQALEAAAASEWSRLLREAKEGR